MFKLAPLGSAQLFTLGAPDSCVPGIPEGVTTGHLSILYGQCVLAALSPLRFFRRLAGRGAFFFGFPLQCVLHFAISFTRCPTVYDVGSHSMEDPLCECGRPYDTMLSLFSTAL